MKPTSAYIIAGLDVRKAEDSFSRGITVNLAGRLRGHGVRVVVASHHEWEEVVEDIRSRPADEIIIIIGHSLGGSVAPQVARLAGREIAAIYGFDPARNWFADGTQYGLTRVPPNVRLASALVESGAGLGGGSYEAESPRDDAHPDGATVVRNKIVNFGHVRNDDDIERHLVIEETIRILRAA